MHIAVVTTYPPGKGSLNEYAYHFVHFLRQKPEVSEVTLLVDDLPAGQTYPAPTDGGAPLRFEPAWRFGALNNPTRIRAAVRRVRPDGVLFNVQFASFGSGKVPATLGLLAPAWVKSAGFPTVVLLHNILETVDLKSAGFDQNPLAELVIRAAGNLVSRQLLKADWVAFTIPKYVELWQTKYRANNVLLAPHGSFEDGALTFTEALPPGPLQILTFGKFGTYKKVETLIEAYQLLRSEGGRDLELVIAGTDNPNASGYLESVRRRYATVPNIRLTGYVAESDVPRLFQEAAVVVFPYTSTTGSSGVLHQAGDYGKAVVLPRIGDFAEVIAEEGYVGEFFEPDNGRSLAAALARVLDNPERRRELGAHNFLVGRGLLVADVVDWYVLHFQGLLKTKNLAAKRRVQGSRER